MPKESPDDDTQYQRDLYRDYVWAVKNLGQQEVGCFWDIEPKEVRRRVTSLALLLDLIEEERKLNVGTF